MNEKEREALKGLLLDEKARLEHELGDIQSGNGEGSSSGGGQESAYRTHMADSATETFDRERDLSLEENVKEMLGRVNAALEKVESGGYGVCAACGDAIDLERLKALPSADKCIECKKKEEAW